MPALFCHEEGATHGSPFIQLHAAPACHSFIVATPCKPSISMRSQQGTSMVVHTREVALPLLRLVAKLQRASAVRKRGRL